MNNYDFDFFIEKFSAIPDERWCEGQLTDEHRRHCALGHCGGLRGLFITDRYGPIREEFPEAKALRELIGMPIGPINNGEFEAYQQPTPKARILAALYDAKARAEAALEAYELRELTLTPAKEPVSA